MKLSRRQVAETIDGILFILIFTVFLPAMMLAGLLYG